MNNADKVEFRGKDWEFYSQGYIKIEDIPLDKSTLSQLSSNHLQQIESYLKNQTHINKTAIAKELDKLKFPLAFLDFETLQDAVPLYTGTKPFEQIPFQYSLHVLEAPDSELIHKEFLANPNNDPREPFIQNLLDDLPKNGTVLVYNQSFEAGILKKFPPLFPEIKSTIQNILDRFYDLMIPFKRRGYYHPNMQGSYSIKKVLPALVPT